MKALKVLKNTKVEFMIILDNVINKYKNNDINILIVGHKCTTGMISAYYEKFPVETIYDDYLELSCKNCEFKKYCMWFVKY